VWEKVFQAFLSTLDAEGKLQGERAFREATVVPAKRVHIRCQAPTAAPTARGLILSASEESPLMRRW